MNVPCGVSSNYRKNTVAPYEKLNIVEVRPSRYLHIQYFKCQGQKIINQEDSRVDQPQAEAKTTSQSLPGPDFETIKNHYFSPDGCSFQDGSKHPDMSCAPTKSSASSQIKDKCEDTVIFFFHGVGGSSGLWISQMQYFSQRGYEIVAPDLIGHGSSCTVKDPRAYYFTEIAADLEEIFKSYGKRKNILIGHSYGASFATKLARDHPRQVHRLVLICGGPPTPLLPPLGLFSLPSCLLNLFVSCLICTFYRRAFYQKKDVVAREKAFKISGSVLLAMMRGQVWPEGDQLYHAEIRLPTLIIYGARDRLVDLREEQDMAKVIPNSRLEVIQHAGHMVMIEAPEQVNSLIDDFICQPCCEDNR